MPLSARAGWQRRMLEGAGAQRDGSAGDGVRRGVHRGAALERAAVVFPSTRDHPNCIMRATPLERCTGSCVAGAGWRRRLGCTELGEQHKLWFHASHQKTCTRNRSTRSGSQSWRHELTCGATWSTIPADD